MKKIFLIILTFLPFLAMAQHTAIPDPNFEQALIDDGIDTDGIINQQVNTADISGLEELNVSFSNISYLTGIEDFINLKILKCSDNNLTNLDFSRNIRLLSVSCYSNQIASIDVSHNPDLLNLDCQDNDLAHINLSHNNKLVTLLATSNNLRSLDLSQNTQLKTVHCGFNKLYKLNLRNGNNPSIEFLNSQNNPDLPCISVDYPADAGSGLGVYSSWYKDASTTYSRECPGITYIPDPNFEQALIDQGIDTDGTLNKKVFTSDISVLEMLNVGHSDIYDLIGIEDFISLKNLICDFNYLNSLDLSNNRKLLSIDCENNNIYALDLSNNVNLQYLACKSNSISHLDLSQNPLLIKASVNSNNITSLDLSQNPNLNHVYCAYNDLHELNLKNGNNSNIGYFNAWGSPNLACIEVDDAVAANAGTGAYATWMKDDGCSYSADCENYTHIPDQNFEQTLINQGYDTDGIINQLVLTSDIAGITHLYIYGMSIKDLTGIEDFISLSYIDCSRNLLSSLDFSNNLLLNTLICSSNLISDVVLDQNTALTQLNCNYNQLTKLDLCQNTALSIILVNHNLLSELNLRNGNNSSIAILYAFDNPNLLCIQVDNPTEANSGLGNYLNWAKDPVAAYSLDCIYSSTLIKPLIAGWTWFSINVETGNMTLGGLLASLDLYDGDYIKSMEHSATYYEGFGWFGSLTELNPKNTYKIKLGLAGDLIIEGLEANLENNHIPIGVGWNWIGYPPQGPIILSEALVSINPVEGDYIKSQSASATYYDSFGWFGDLSHMDPKGGFMLKSGKDETLTYPAGPVASIQLAGGSSQSAIGSRQSAIMKKQGIEFNPSSFEFSGQVNAEVLLNGEIIGDEEDMLITMSEGRIVGRSSAMVFPPTGLPVFSHLAFENSVENRNLEFYFFDLSHDQWYKFDETLQFEPDMIEADAYKPFRLEKASMIQNPTSDIRHLTSLEVYPNPATDYITINLELADDRNITLQILDPLGRIVDEIQPGNLTEGSHQFTHDIRFLKQGYYLIRIKDQPEISQRLIITQ